MLFGGVDNLNDNLERLKKQRDRITQEINLTEGLLKLAQSGGGSDLKLQNVEQEARNLQAPPLSQSNQNALAALEEALKGV